MTTLIVLLSLPFIHIHPNQGRPVNVQGVSCWSGSPIEYYPSGKLKQCVLASNNPISGYTCGSAGIFKLYESGKLQECVFTTVTRWNNTNPVSCWYRNTVTLYEKGTLDKCVLNENYTVDGVRCGSATWIYLYENGKLKSCHQL